MSFNLPNRSSQPRWMIAVRMWPPFLVISPAKSTEIMYRRRILDRAVFSRSARCARRTVEPVGEQVAWSRGYQHTSAMFVCAAGERLLGPCLILDALQLSLALEPISSQGMGGRLGCLCQFPPVMIFSMFAPVPVCKLSFSTLTFTSNLSYPLGPRRIVSVCWSSSCRCY